MTTTITGLTAAEVAERVADGRVNNVPDAPVRSLGQIIRANVLTPVNGIISTLFVLILIAGYPADALFAGVIVSNSVIGIVQELQARRTLNELAVLSAPKARVRRDGDTVEVGISEVVADDILELSPGDQVVVDGDVLAASGLELDESLLTGESDPVEKHEDDQVLSGSFVSAGSGFYRATHIGADSYAAKLSEEARRFELADSELRRGVNIILRWLTFIIPPASVLLKKAAGVPKGAGDPQKQVVGRVTKEQLEEIAKIKMPDLNCVKVESAMKVVAGTAANMGIKIDGWPEVDAA